MQPTRFTEDDLNFLKSKNITKGMIENQLRSFEKGFPYLNVLKASDIGNGITHFDDAALKENLRTWESYLDDPNVVVVKFVPSSGAASRMFKSLFQYMNSGSDEAEKDEHKMSSDVEEVLDHLSDFAFSSALDRACLLNAFKTMSNLYQMKEYRTILGNLLSQQGLNYGNLPKGMILFHNYPEGPRTAAEEHLAEGALYAKNVSGKVNIHFTLSPEHLDEFKALLQRKKDELEKHFSVEYDLSYSIQKPETDTIAVDMNNEPMRNDDGSLMMRPGGHGALIQNLNDIDADIIFIKNIDNVVPDRYKSDTIIYKKAIGGYLVYLKDKVYSYMSALSDDRKSSSMLNEIREFIQEAFSIDTASLDGLSPTDMAVQLRKILNRPIRVCGMVRNEGEPGGGPYVVRNENGLTSLQILESTQINMNSDADVEIFKSGKYFNPVDLVCCVKDYRGQKFNLTAFVDEKTGFISYKSKDGKELKALELPGLWNGAMSDWLTAFVEVPATTFNPVKVVNDLLRNFHQ